MSLFTTFVIAALGTYAMRVTMLVVLAGRSLPRALVTPVTLVGPAALGALTVGAMAGRGHRPEMSTLFATVVAFAVVRRTGRVTHGLIAGFVVVWVVNAIVML